jgi:hypothetical protein
MSAKKQQFQAELSSLKDKYMQMLYDLYNLAPHCDSFFCYNLELEKKYSTSHLDSLDKNYFFEYKVETDRSFGAAYNSIVYEFITQLTPLLNVKAYQSKEVLNDSGLSQNKSKQTVKKYFNGLEVGLYLKNKQPHLFFAISLKGKNTNPCSELFLNELNDRFTAMKFNSYKLKNGTTLSMSQTEVTIGLFKKFLATVKNQKKFFAGITSYKKFLKSRDDQPISGINSSALRKFINWLNDNNPNGDLYRVPSCKEWQEIASCGGKIKYCWGDMKLQNNYNENIRCNKKRRSEPMNVASFQKSKSYMYDMCGNVSEYCYGVNHFGKNEVQVVGGNYKTEQHIINETKKYQKGRHIGFRIAKE